MQVQQNNTPESWAAVIAELTTRADAEQAELAQLTRERETLVLDAELGNETAVRQARKLGDQIQRLTAAAADRRVAIAQAETRKHEAEAAAAAAVDRERRAAIAAHARVFEKHVRRVSKVLGDLKDVLVAMESEQEAMARLSGPNEHQTISALSSVKLKTALALHFGHVGLNRFLDLQVGPGYTSHFKPLAERVRGDLEMLIAAGEEQQ